MIGIEAIGSYVPEKRVDNTERMAQFNVDELFLKTKTGMLQLAKKEEYEETSDLCCKAFTDLQAKVNVIREDIDCVIVVTQNPDAKGLPHTSAIVHEKLGLAEACAVFDISLGCSGFVYGLSVIQSFMQVNGFRKGLLFNCDPYSKIVDVNDKNTSLLFGDAATVTLLSNNPVWKTGHFVFGSQGNGAPGIRVNPATERLEMNGRAVFSFSATVVPRNILQMLKNNNLDIENIDLFAFHQGSRFIVDTLRKKLAVDENKVPFSAAMYGNTVSASIPLLLNEVEEAVDTVVIAGFGVGLSWASTVLFRIKE